MPPIVPKWGASYLFVALLLVLTAATEVSIPPTTHDAGTATDSHGKVEVPFDNIDARGNPDAMGHKGVSIDSAMLPPDTIGGTCYIAPNSTGLGALGTRIDPLPSIPDCIRTFNLTLADRQSTVYYNIYVAPGTYTLNVSSENCATQSGGRVPGSVIPLADNVVLVVQGPSATISPPSYHGPRPTVGADPSKLRTTPSVSTQVTFQCSEFLPVCYKKYTPGGLIITGPGRIMLRDVTLTGCQYAITPDPMYGKNTPKRSGSIVLHRSVLSYNGVVVTPGRGNVSISSCDVMHNFVDSFVEVELPGVSGLAYVGALVQLLEGEIYITDTFVFNNTVHSTDTSRTCSCMFFVFKGSLSFENTWLQANPSSILVGPGGPESPIAVSTTVIFYNSALVSNTGKRTNGALGPFIATEQDIVMRWSNISHARYGNALFESSSKLQIEDSAVTGNSQASPMFVLRPSGTTVMQATFDRLSYSEIIADNRPPTPLAMFEGLTGPDLPTRVAIRNSTIIARHHYIETIQTFLFSLSGDVVVSVTRSTITTTQRVAQLLSRAQWSSSKNVYTLYALLQAYSSSPLAFFEVTSGSRADWQQDSVNCIPELTQSNSGHGTYGLAYPLIVAKGSSSLNITDSVFNTSNGFDPLYLSTTGSVSVHSNLFYLRNPRAECNGLMCQCVECIASFRFIPQVFEFIRNVVTGCVNTAAVFISTSGTDSGAGNGHLWLQGNNFVQVHRSLNPTVTPSDEHGVVLIGPHIIGAVQIIENNFLGNSMSSIHAKTLVSAQALSLHMKRNVFWGWGQEQYPVHVELSSNSTIPPVPYVNIGEHVHVFSSANSMCVSPASIKKHDRNPSVPVVKCTDASLTVNGSFITNTPARVQCNTTDSYPVDTYTRNSGDGRVSGFEAFVSCPGLDHDILSWPDVSTGLTSLEVQLSCLGDYNAATTRALTSILANIGPGELGPQAYRSLLDDLSRDLPPPAQCAKSGRRNVSISNTNTTLLHSNSSVAGERVTVAVSWEDEGFTADVNEYRFSITTMGMSVSGIDLVAITSVVALSNTDIESSPRVFGLALTHVSSSFEVSFRNQAGAKVGVPSRSITLHINEQGQSFSLNSSARSSSKLTFTHKFTDSGKASFWISEGAKESTNVTVVVLWFGWLIIVPSVVFLLLIVVIAFLVHRRFKAQRSHMHANQVALQERLLAKEQEDIGLTHRNFLLTHETTSVPFLSYIAHDGYLYGVCEAPGHWHVVRDVRGEKPLSENELEITAGNARHVLDFVDLYPAVCNPNSIHYTGLPESDHSLSRDLSWHPSINNRGDRSDRIDSWTSDARYHQVVRDHLIRRLSGHLQRVRLGLTPEQGYGWMCPIHVAQGRYELARPYDLSVGILRAMGALYTGEQAPTTSSLEGKVNYVDIAPSAKHPLTSPEGEIVSLVLRELEQTSFLSKIDVTKIRVVYNPALNTTFAHRDRVLRIGDRRNLARRWPDTHKQLRRLVYGLLRGHTDRLRDTAERPLSEDGAHLDLVWHAANGGERSLMKIASVGFLSLARLNSGWYGRGVYFTHYPEYAQWYAPAPKRLEPNMRHKNLTPAGERMLILSWTSLGHTYPVVERMDRAKDPGHAWHAGYPGHDSHYTVVQPGGRPAKFERVLEPARGEEGQEADITPGGIEQGVFNVQGAYDEICIFQEAAMLPRFIVYYKER